MDANIPSASKGCISVMEKVSLPPVSPCDYGEGFPYAPVDWPNAGDVWGWKVGNRFNSSGFFSDRVLLVPKHYEPSQKKRCLLSKLSVKRYLQSEHPNADIEAFFASFSWEVPVKKQFVKKVKDTPRPQKFCKLEAGKVVGGGSQGKMTPKQVLHGQQTRRSSRLLAQFARSRMYTNTVIDLCSDNDGTSIGDQTTSDSNSSQINSTESDKSKYPASSSTATSHSLDRVSAEGIIKDLDDYINSLDGILAQPPQGVRFSLPTAELTLGMPPKGVGFSLPTEELTQDMAQARKKLSEILIMDLSALLSSKDLITQIETLSSKLQRDSTITGPERSLLNLIEEIPTAIKDFEETKKVEEEAEKFFTELEANITLATNLKSEYNESRNKAACLEAKINSGLLEIEEFNEQITILQSRRAQASNILEKTKRKMARVRSKQEVAARRLPNVVREVEMAQSERSKWVLKKETRTYLEASILEKFAPLEGFSFCKPLEITFVDKID